MYLFINQSYCNAVIVVFRFQQVANTQTVPRLPVVPLVGRANTGAHALRCAALWLESHLPGLPPTQRHNLQSPVRVDFLTHITTLKYHPELSTEKKVSFDNYVSPLLPGVRELLLFVPHCWGNNGGWLSREAQCFAVRVCVCVCSWGVGDLSLRRCVLWNEWWSVEAAGLPSPFSETKLK